MSGFALPDLVAEAAFGGHVLDLSQLEEAEETGFELPNLGFFGEEGQMGADKVTDGFQLDEALMSLPVEDNPWSPGVNMG